MLNSLPLDQREKAEEDMEKIRGRPDVKDLEEAIKFAQSTLNKIK